MQPEEDGGGVRGARARAARGGLAGASVPLRGRVGLGLVVLGPVRGEPVLVGVLGGGRDLRQGPAHGGPGGGVGGGVGVLAPVLAPAARRLGRLVAALAAAIVTNCNFIFKILKSIFILIYTEEI